MSKQEKLCENSQRVSVGSDESRIIEVQDELFYTLDDIEIGESSTDPCEPDYIECMSRGTDEHPEMSSTGDASPAENNNNSDETKTKDAPVYFELEKTPEPDTDEKAGKNVVNKLVSQFETKNPGKDSSVPKETVSSGFDDHFIPAPADVPTVKKPFDNFDDVVTSDPVYEVAGASAVSHLQGEGHESEGQQSSAENVSDPIYDAVPSRTNSNVSALSVAGGEPIYEPLKSAETKSKGEGEGQVEGELGSVYSVAKEAVENAVRQKDISKGGAGSDSVYEFAQTESGILGLNNYDFMTRSHPPNYPSCKQGAGRPVSVQFLDRAEEARKQLKAPSKSWEDGDYDKLRFRKFNSKKGKSRSQFYISTPLDEEEQITPIGRPRDDDAPAETDVAETDRLYESISTSNLSDFGWGSSEFEDSDDEQDDVILDVAPDKPLPPEPRQTKLGEDVLAEGAKFISRIRSLRRNKELDTDEDQRCFPVELDAHKHPQPQLPPAPEDLTESQRKRRCVVDLTISSEKSYINSLERITEGYEKDILGTLGGPRSHVRIVFKEAHQLLSHHKMFQIELAERAQKWDQEEKIGDIFTASFSKTMLVDAYSAYVNSFAAAMEEIKCAQRTKPAFDEFLRTQEKKSSDRLSIFGLMVKPIQRFPQFIMVLQDLLKYTPRDHHDRGALQLALTELENVAHKLNERKRYSEQMFAARQITSQVSRQLNQIAFRILDKPRRLLRQDDLEQVIGETQSMKSKKVRLVMMNDLLMCVKVGIKEQGGYTTERYKLKWMANIRDIELKDSAITPDMESILKGGPGKLSIYSTQIERPEEDPFHLFADLNEMLHDYPVLAQIGALITALKRTYLGLTEEYVHELTRDLQRLIQIKDEQLRLVNSCSIILSDHSKSEKSRYVFQTPTSAMKHEWCMDFLIAKLAIEKQNNPAWATHADEDSDPPPAYFMRCLPVDVPRHYTKMKCAIPVFLSSSSGARLGIQHLWVVTTTPTRGQVSIISIHNSKPSLTESFKAADVEITCTEHVPGFADEDSEFAFHEDTVWLGTIDNEILIFPLTSSDGMRRQAVVSFTLPAAPVTMIFVDERLFCSLVNGALAVFSRNQHGAWNVKDPKILRPGKMVITCMKVIKDDLWIALATKLLVLEIDSLKEKAVHDLGIESENLLIHEFVISGVGIWVSFKDSAKLRLYHAETRENLQEIIVASTVNRLLEEKKNKVLNADQLDSYQNCHVTSMSASKGLLWIGTNRGFVLTFPLPRLRDGVPLASGRPKISIHSHRGPVRFLLPIYYSSSVAELNRNSSLWSSVKTKRSSFNKDINPSIPETKEEDKILEETPQKECGDNVTETVNSVTEPSGATPEESEKGEVTLDKEEVTPDVSMRSSSRAGDTHKRISQTEIWQAEIDESAAGGKETASSDTKEQKLPSAEVEAKSGGKRKTSIGAKSQTISEGKRKKSLKEGIEALKRDKPKRNKSKTLSFRSELANKIAQRNFASSESELADDEDDDVMMLYENLLETDEDIESDEENFQDAVSSFEELPNDLGTPQNALSIRKNAQGVTWGEGVTLPGTAKRSSHTLHRSSQTLHRASTMKKNMSNAVIIVCGGDGYCDWNKTKQKTVEDASLMLWIYKF